MIPTEGGVLYASYPAFVIAFVSHMPALLWVWEIVRPTNAVWTFSIIDMTFHTPIVFQRQFLSGHETRAFAVSKYRYEQCLFAKKKLRSDVDGMKVWFKKIMKSARSTDSAYVLSNVCSCFSQVMRLDSRKDRWNGERGQATRSISIDNESELDDKDLRLCLHDQMNSTTHASSQSPRSWTIAMAFKKLLLCIIQTRTERNISETKRRKNEKTQKKKGTIL